MDQTVLYVVLFLLAALNLETRRRCKRLERKMDDLEPDLESVRRHATAAVAELRRETRAGQGLLDIEGPPTPG